MSAKSAGLAARRTGWQTVARDHALPPFHHEKFSADNTLYSRLMSCADFATDHSSSVDYLIHNPP